MWCGESWKTGSWIFCTWCWAQFPLIPEHASHTNPVKITEDNESKQKEEWLCKYLYGLMMSSGGSWLRGIECEALTSPFSGGSPLPKVDATTINRASCSIDDMS